MSENGLEDFAVRIEEDSSSRLGEIWDRIWAERDRLRRDLAIVSERQRQLAGRHFDLVLQAVMFPREKPALF